MSDTSASAQVAACDAQLAALDAATAPAEWAKTQWRKASALVELANSDDQAANLRAADWHEGDRAANARAAIELYEDALEVLTERAFPWDFAVTQRGLAYAISESDDFDVAARIRAEIECYDAALRVFSRDDDGHDWASTMLNKALALLEAEDLAAALRCIDGAIEVFAQIENVFDLEWAKSIRARILKERDE